MEYNKCSDMSNMFNGIKLNSLPDISKWDATNVTDMSYMLDNVKLSSLPDISKWNNLNVTDMSNMFGEKV